MSKVEESGAVGAAAAHAEAAAVKPSAGGPSTLEQATSGTAMEPAAMEPAGATAVDNDMAPEAPAGIVTADPWRSLRRFTAARIALGRSGISQPTAPQLAFQLAHAQARDAVHLALDHEALAARLGPACGLPCLQLHSAAESRHVYLQRPDLGRGLDAASRLALAAARAAASPRAAPAARAGDAGCVGVIGAVGAGAAPSAAPGGEAAADETPYDLAIVIADGLSALAIEQNALPFLQALLPRLNADQWRIAPLAIVRQARVAVGDEVAHALGARAVVVLVGERPGLSSPDSMGLYLTWAPRPGLTDASRNCISNVRPAGLTCAAAAVKLRHLLTEARRRGLSGVALKDETADDAGLLDAPRRDFLLGDGP